MSAAREILLAKKKTLNKHCAGKMTAKLDPYQRRARLEGYRSRAAYKLIEIDDRYTILTNCQGIVELGGYPGGWTQVIRQRAPRAKLVVCDLIDPTPRQPDPQTIYVRGDFRRATIRDQITTLMASTPINLVVSDMAPSISGDRLRDQAHIKELAEQVLNYALLALAAAQGRVVIKFFQGEETDYFVAQMRQRFQLVRIFKPNASKKRSKEIYLIGTHPVVK